MYSTGQFSLDALTTKIKNQQGENYIIAISPDFITGNQGFDAFHQFSQPTMIYFNNTGTVDVQEYRYTTQLIQTRQAPVRAYAVKL